MTSLLLLIYKLFVCLSQIIAMVFSGGVRFRKSPEKTPTPRGALSDQLENLTSWTSSLSEWVTADATQAAATEAATQAATWTALLGSLAASAQSLNVSGQYLWNCILQREPEKPKTTYEKVKIYVFEKVSQVRQRLRLDFVSRNALF